MFDGEAFGAEIVAQVKGYVERETRGLREEIEGLKARLGEVSAPVTPDAVRAMVDEAVSAIPVPKDGEPGKDADPDVIRSMVEEAIALIPVPKDGDPGKDIDPEAVKAMIEEAVASLPPAKDGQDADPEVIRSMVAEAVAELPPAEPGKDAEPITPEQIAEAVQRHIEANPIKHGEPGSDGVGLAGALIDKDGELVVTMTDGSMRTLGRVVGRDAEPGAKGEPGRDALQLTDFDTALSEDGRFLTLSLENDEVKVTHELQLPTMIYRGVFSEGRTYRQGDTVTFGGSLWHCNAETTDKPIDGNPAWTLAAKRGANGKDAKA